MRLLPGRKRILHVPLRHSTHCARTFSPSTRFTFQFRMTIYGQSMLAEHPLPAKIFSAIQIQYKNIFVARVLSRRRVRGAGEGD